MGEPRVRTKTIDEVNEQYLRIRNRLEKGIRAAQRAGDTQRVIQLAGRGATIGYVRNRYVNNMRTSTAVQRAMKDFTPSERTMFTSSFGGANGVRVPRSQYMKNNR